MLHDLEVRLYQCGSRWLSCYISDLISFKHYVLSLLLCASELRVVLPRKLCVELIALRL